jgi:hypothetical protein
LWQKKTKKFKSIFVQIFSKVLSKQTIQFIKKKQKGFLFLMKINVLQHGWNQEQIIK